MVDFKKLIPGDKVVLVTEHGRIDLTRIYGRYKYRVAADCLARPALGNIFTREGRPDDIEVRLDSGVSLDERILRLAIPRL
ncbi:MAG: hypothetical protein ACYC9Q_03195 [Bacillota bacterium]